MATRGASHDDSSVGLPLRSGEPGHRMTLGSFVRTRFVTGLLVSFPLVVTIFFGRFLFDLLDLLGRDLKPEEALHEV